MNYSMIRYILFRLMRVHGFLLMLPFTVALIYREYDSAEALERYDIAKGWKKG